jgi:hypothetical protein
MPRYFFHVHDGEEIIDHEGTELADAEDARVEAVVLSGGMLKDAGPRFWNNGEWRLHVTDEAGATVCALLFSAEHRDKLLQ